MKGRPIDYKKLEQARKYRAQGLTFGEIAKLMESHKKSVWRWMNYDVGEREKLSTGKVLTVGKSK